MDRAALIAAMQRTAATAAVPKLVKVAGWPPIYVRVLTVAEVDVNRADDSKADEKTKLARGAAHVICDESGVRLFDAKNEADIALLAAQPWPLMNAVVAAASDANGASEAAAVEAGNG